MADAADIVPLRRPGASRKAKPVDQRAYSIRRRLRKRGRERRRRLCVGLRVGTQIRPPSGRSAIPATRGCPEGASERPKSPTEARFGNPAAIPVSWLDPQRRAGSCRSRRCPLPRCLGYVWKWRIRAVRRSPSKVALRSSARNRAFGHPPESWLRVSATTDDKPPGLTLGFSSSVASTPPRSEPRRSVIPAITVRRVSATRDGPGAGRASASAARLRGVSSRGAGPGASPDSDQANFDISMIQRRNARMRASSAFAFGLTT